MISLEPENPLLQTCVCGHLLLDHKFGNGKCFGDRRDEHDCYCERAVVLSEDEEIMREVRAMRRQR